MAGRPEIDGGAAHDWSRVSEEYGRYRDLYPEAFYQKLTELGLCISGQRVLDLGTGTGVLPRNMAKYGADFVGADPSEGQIAVARKLTRAAGLSIPYVVASAETAAFEDDRFDVVTACQCFVYFDKAKALPNIYRMLKPGGRLAVLFMGWLPGESAIAGQSEALVLRYNPAWTGGGMTRFVLPEPAWAPPLFETKHRVTFALDVPFTRESWHGRMLACRGTGASLPPDKLESFAGEHRALLERIAPESFTIPHYAAMLILQVTK